MKYSYEIETLESQVFGEEELALLPEAEEDVEPEKDIRPEEETDREISADSDEENLDLESEIRNLEESDPIVMMLTLEDGSQMECGVAGVFLEGEREYIALETPEGKIHIMELGREEDDGINLIPVEDEEEQERVIETFIQLFAEEEPEPEMEEESILDRQEPAEPEQDSAPQEELKGQE